MQVEHPNARAPKLRSARLAAAFLLCITSAHAQGHREPSDARSCVPAAAAMHGVNPDILQAILTIESRLNPKAINVNSDGSTDVGVAGINSIHFADLSRVGVAPADLFDPCKGTFVAAWLVSKKLRRYGNTWFGYAAFHSKTPYYNHRYQILLANELVKKGVVPGQIMPVPPLRPR